MENPGFLFLAGTPTAVSPAPQICNSTKKQAIHSEMPAFPAFSQLGTAWKPATQQTSLGTKPHAPSSICARGGRRPRALDRRESRQDSYEVRPAVLPKAV